MVTERKEECAGLDPYVFRSMYGLSSVELIVLDTIGRFVNLPKQDGRRTKGWRKALIADGRRAAGLCSIMHLRRYLRTRTP